MTGRHDTTDDSPRSDRLIDDALGRDREALRRGRPHDAKRAAAALLAATPAAGASGMEGLAAKGFLVKALGAKIAVGIMVAGAGTAILVTALPSTEEGNRTVGRDAIAAPAPEVALPTFSFPESTVPAASSDDARVSEAGDDKRGSGPVVEPRRRVTPSIVSPQQPDVVPTETEKVVTPSERKYRKSDKVDVTITIRDGSEK